VTRAAIAIVLVALVALGPIGCAHRRPEPIAALPDKPPTGTVAVVVSSKAAYASFQRPGVVGAGPGAMRGASVGALAPLAPGVFVLTNNLRDARVFLFGLAMLGAGLVLAPVGAGVGATVGAIAAPSGDDVEQTTAALERALTEANLSEVLAAWILEEAGDRPVVAGTDPEIFAADTVLEIGQATVSLLSNDATDWRPRLRLRVMISGTLVRASDGETLGSWTWTHEGGEARLTEWGKDDARRFREELGRAERALTARIVTEVF
jgi:hypothetical protein